jgi:hypothetical protein
MGKAGCSHVDGRHGSMPGLDPEQHCHRCLTIFIKLLGYCEIGAPPVLWAASMFMHAWYSLGHDDVNIIAPGGGEIVHFRGSGAIQKF